MNGDLLIRNVRPNGGAKTDLRIKDGKIAEVGPSLPPSNAEILDGGNQLLLPGLVEAHAHLDKTLWGMGWRKNTAGPRLIDKIDNERRIRKAIDIDPERQSARQVVQSIKKGSTHIRTHVDVDTDHGMWGIDGVMATREKYRDVMDIEIVAFPQSGLLVRPGTVELMDEAMKRGAEVVGGLDPCAIDRDPKGHLDAVFGLAQKHGRGVDIHLHEPGEMGAFSMDLIIERTRALGMRGTVTVSHAFCLGHPDRDLIDPLLEQLAELDIAIMTTGSASRPVPPIARLRKAGITVCAGSDGIRDSWGPYGDADMLARAMFLGLRNNFRKDEEVEIGLEACTYGGAKVMGLKAYGIGVGCAADLLLVPGETPTEAVVSQPDARTVIKRGRVIARDGVSSVTAP